MKQRNGRLANIRALAICLVVLGHSIILYSTAWNLYQTTVSVPFLNLLKVAVDIPQMLLFFALSGYLFRFTHEKKRGFGNLLKNKALRLLVPYVGIGLCYMLPIRLAVGYSSYRSAGVWELAKKFLLSTDVGHLWFLPALFCVFLLSEGILWLAEKIPGVKKYPELFLLVVAFGLYLQGYRIGFGYPPLLNAYNYLMWFALGYCLNVYRDAVKKIYAKAYIKWPLVVLNLALIAYVVAGGSLRLLLSLGMRALCVINAFGAMPEKSCALTEKIDRNSFGVYLFHSPLVYITFATIPNASPLLVVVLNFVVFGAVAYGLTELVRKTKLRVLIGEAK